MSSLYRRDDSSYWWVAFEGPDGKRYNKSTKCRDQAEARKVLANIEARLAKMDPTARAPEIYTVASWAAKWAQSRIEKGRWTNAKLDLRALEDHVAGARVMVHGAELVLGRLLLDQVRVIHVRAWLETMARKKLASNTVLSVYSLMNRAFRAAVNEEVISINPCAGLERGELPRLADKDPGFRKGAVFTLRELELLVSDQRVPLDRRLAYAIAFLGGLREGEVSALTWEDYDATLQPLGRLYVSKSYTRKNKRVKGTKTGVPREVPVHGVTAALLAEWQLSGWEAQFDRRQQPTDLLVPNRAGRHLTDLNLWGNLQHDLEVLGLRRRRFHDTKATFVTYALDGGAQWSFLKRISHGATKKEMRDVYARPPWEVLCAQVRCIKAQLRGASVLIPLQATGTTQVSELRFPATIQESRMQQTEATVRTTSAQGEIRTPPGSRHEGSPEGDSRGSLTPEGAGGPHNTQERSASAAFSRRLRPLVGGRVRPFRKTKGGG